jgi:hypothetical protein
LPSAATLSSLQFNVSGIIGPTLDGLLVRTKLKVPNARVHDHLSPSSDGSELPGLVVEPDSDQTATSTLLFLHGKGEAGLSLGALPPCMYSSNASVSGSTRVPS